MNNKQRRDEGWVGFLKLCKKLPNPQKLNEFFNLFLTFEEKDSLATRYLVIKTMLQKAITQREIAKDLNISIAKITRGSNALKTINEELKKYLKSHM